MASGLQAVSRVDSWPSGNQQVARTEEEKVSRTGTSAAIRMVGDMGGVGEGYNDWSVQKIREARKSDYGRCLIVGLETSSIKSGQT